MTNYQITVRHGDRGHRYHTLAVEASDVAQALHRAADQLPAEVVGTANLVELRESVESGARRFDED